MKQLDVHFKRSMERLKPNNYNFVVLSSSAMFNSLLKYGPELVVFWNFCIPAFDVLMLMFFILFKD